MIAVLVASGVATQAAVAAVVLYRLVNFWLPTAPAVVAFVTLRRRLAVAPSGRTPSPPAAQDERRDD